MQGIFAAISAVQAVLWIAWCASVLLLIIRAPGHHRLEHGPQAVAGSGQGIFHARRYLGVDLAREQAFGLHIAQLRGQDLLRDVTDGLFQLAEALRPCLL